MTWREFEQSAPELATLARREFARVKLALVGTLRRDGSPRISCVEPWIFDDELYLGMMRQSRKAVDLVRDPRLILHNAISTNTGKEVELGIRGRAASVRKGKAYEEFRRAVTASAGSSEPRFHLFVVDIEAVSLIRYADGQQHVQVWPRGIEFTRPYGF